MYTNSYRPLFKTRVMRFFREGLDAHGNIIQESLLVDVFNVGCTGKCRIGVVDNVVKDVIEDIEHIAQISMECLFRVSKINIPDLCYVGTRSAMVSIMLSDIGERGVVNDYYVGLFQRIMRCVLAHVEERDGTRSKESKRSKIVREYGIQYRGFCHDNVGKRSLRPPVINNMRELDITICYIRKYNFGSPPWHGTPSGCFFKQIGKDDKSTARLINNFINEIKYLFNTITCFRESYTEFSSLSCRDTHNGRIIEGNYEYQVLCMYECVKIVMNFLVEHDGMPLSIALDMLLVPVIRRCIRHALVRVEATHIHTEDIVLALRSCIMHDYAKECGIEYVVKCDSIHDVDLKQYWKQLTVKLEALVWVKKCMIDRIYVRNKIKNRLFARNYDAYNILTVFSRFMSESYGVSVGMTEYDVRNMQSSIFKEIYLLAVLMNTRKRYDPQYQPVGLYELMLLVAEELSNRLSDREGSIRTVVYAMFPAIEEYKKACNIRNVIGIRDWIELFDVVHRGNKGHCNYDVGAGFMEFMNKKIELESVPNPVMFTSDYYHDHLCSADEQYTLSAYIIHDAFKTNIIPPATLSSTHVTSGACTFSYENSLR